METQQAIETYLASDRPDEEKIEQGFHAGAEPDAFVGGMQAQMALHQQQLMRRYLTQLGSGITLSVLRTAVRMLNTVDDAGAKDAIYQNTVELVGACNRDAIDSILTATADPDPELRALGGTVLGLYEDPPARAVEMVESLLHDDDLLVRYAAATALVLWGDDANQEAWRLARLQLIDFATKAMHLLPEAAVTHARASAEMGHDYASATLFLRVLPQLLGTRG